MNGILEWFPSEVMFRAFVYSFTLAAGVAVIFTNSGSTLEGALRSLLPLWVLFTVVGSALGLFGVLTDLWLPELIGSPMVATALAIYGSIMLMTGGDHPPRFPLGFLFLALATTLAGRAVDIWRYVTALQR